MPENENRVISDEDEQLYREILAEIKKRMEYVWAHLPDAVTRPDFESCALQLRLSIEAFVMGSLVTNREALEAANIALSSKKLAGEAAKAAKAANPDYWPNATEPQKREGAPIDLVPIAGALSEEHWQREWGHLSAYLHARNPFKPHASLDEMKERIGRVAEELRLLTQHHSIHWRTATGCSSRKLNQRGSL